MDSECEGNRLRDKEEEGKTQTVKKENKSVGSAERIKLGAKESSRSERADGGEATVISYGG